MTTSSANANVPSDHSVTTKYKNTKRKATENSPSLEPQRKQMRKKRLRFHSSVKRNDGLRYNTDLFNQYMKEAFGKVKKRKGQTVVTILARNMNVYGLFTVQKMISDLIKRCLLSSRGYALILPQGGGIAGRIYRKHIPYLVKHIEHLENVISKVRTVIAHKQQKK